MILLETKNYVTISNIKKVVHSTIGYIALKFTAETKTTGNMLSLKAEKRRIIYCEESGGTPVNRFKHSGTSTS